MIELSADAAALTGIAAVLTATAALIWSIRRDRKNK